MKELEDAIVDLWHQGFCPPYRLIISDGGGQSVAFDVTVTMNLAEGESFEPTIAYC